jgi:pimeloyl-[acyl-carrier protein] methyl ester esterase
VTPSLLFAHGWALDRRLWDRVIALLGEAGRGALLRDDGYWGSPADPQVQGPVLGVGQSLGALELLAAPPPGLIGIVAIDGFARFGQAPDFPEGVPLRVLQRMQARLADGALADFMARAGGALPSGEPDLDRLAEGLDRLYALDGRACRLPIWRLHSENDPIAPPALADAAFAGMEVVEDRRRASADHLSPVHAPRACADLIRVAVKVLS